MWNNKIAMATFRTCCAKMAAKLKKKMNEDVRALKDALENLNIQKSTSRGILSSIFSKMQNEFKPKLKL